MNNLSKNLKISILASLLILIITTTRAKADWGDLANNLIMNLFQPLIFSALAVPVFGSNLSDAFRLIGINPPSNTGIDRFLVYLGSNTLDFYYGTLVPISIGLSGLAIFLGAVSLLFEGLGFLREGEAYTTIKWALIAPILTYIFPPIWNALAILTASINAQLIDIGSLLTIAIGQTIQAALGALLATAGLGFIVLAAGFIVMVLFYVLTMLIFGATRIAMMTAFVLLTPIFIPLMKIPKFGGIFQKFTTYAIEMLVATIVASMLMKTVLLLIFNAGLTANNVFLSLGLIFTLIFTPFISLFVTNWVLGTAAGVVALAGEHALERSSTIIGGFAAGAISTGAISGPIKLAGGTALGAVAGGGIRNSRIIGDVAVGSAFSKAGATLLSNPTILPAGAGLAAGIGLTLGKAFEKINKWRMAGDIKDAIKTVNPKADPKDYNIFLPPDLLYKINTMDNGLKETMYEVIGAEAAGLDYGTLKNEDKDKARILGQYIVDFNRKILQKTSPGYLQKLNEKAVYKKESWRSSAPKLIPEWSEKTPIEYFDLYKLEKKARAYLSETNPAEKTKLMNEINHLLNTTQFMTRFGNNIEDWGSGKQKIGNILNVFDQNPQLLQYRLWASKMDTELNVAEKKRHTTGGAHELFRKIHRASMSKQFHKPEIEILKETANQKHHGDLFKAEEKAEDPNISSLEFAEHISLAGTLAEKTPKITNLQEVDKIYEDYEKFIEDKFKDVKGRISAGTMEIKDGFDRVIADHLVNVKLAEKVNENNIRITQEERALAEIEIEKLRAALEHDLKVIRGQEKMRIIRYNTNKNKNTETQRLSR
ncbi:MAG: hypothetical protein ACP5IZ_09835 [Thermoprotei archaeon]|jgi:hypothetical protein